MSILGYSANAKATVLWEHIDGRLTPINSLTREPIAWAAQPGSAEIFMQCMVPEVLLTGPRGTGKGLPLSEPVLTPTGMRPIASLRIGDDVCCPNGDVAQVVGKYPQGIRPVYEITFYDGSVARCDDQHIWPIHTQWGGPGYRLCPMTYLWEKFSQGKEKCYVPTLTCAEFDAAGKLEVQPYWLGLLLGDGTCSDENGIRYCTDDEELAVYWLGQGAVETKPDARNGLRNFRVKSNHKDFEKFKSLGIFGKTARHKSVPPKYLVANRQERLALLQGLMDTDGTTSGGSCVCFCSSSVQLAKDVQSLVWSLGGKATLTYKQSVDAWLVHIQHGNKFQPFRLSRKVAQVGRFMHKHLWREIVSITKLEPEETVCIKINSLDGLFITRDYTVTHNTDAFIMDFAQHCERGFGVEWKGIIFRRTYPELDDIIGKSRKWFPRIFGDRCKYNAGQSKWVWKSGEQLLFRHFLDKKDYDHYHGSSYPWIGWEELTTWPNLDGYLAMFSCNRSADPRIPRKIRATTNPYGVGFNAVKRRFRLPVPRGKVLGEYIVDGRSSDGQLEPPRIAINSSLAENRMLLEADPGYIQRIRTSAANPSQADAWINGSWDIVSGGLVDDVWEPQYHVLYGLQKMPICRIPRSWRITRAYDHGQSRPFSVGWWAESDGEPFEFNGRSYGHIRGDLFRIAEWYGNQLDEDDKGLRLPATKIAEGILARESDWNIRGRVEPGPADAAIFNGSEADQSISVYRDMLLAGVQWLRSTKGPGSRMQGWEQLRKYLAAAKPGPGGYREEPGLFVFPRCNNFIRLVPALPRDEKNPDDCPKDACDHIGDETRYMLRFARGTIASESWK